MVGSEKIELKQAVQVCVVVKDIQKAMERYWNLGIGPWAIYTFQSPELTNTTFQGKPAKYSMKLAIAMIGSVMWELIEPLEDRVRTRNFLRRKGRVFIMSFWPQTIMNRPSQPSSRKVLGF